MTYYEKILEGTEFLKEKLGGMTPTAAIVLGSGLSSFVEEVDIKAEIPFSSIPHFKTSSVEGHGNKLVVGDIAGKRLLVMVGRIHYYEGYTMEEVTYPIRLFTSLGIPNLILTNAAGGMKGEPGQLNLISDHLSFFCPTPLRGENMTAFGERFPDATSIYTPELRQLGKGIGEKLGIIVGEGVYAYMTGPMYETPAEIRSLALLGADMVGMSTVPEAMVAAHGGMKVLGISCITNMAAGISGKPLNHNEVIEVSKRVEADFKSLIAHIVREI